MIKQLYERKKNPRVKNPSYSSISFNVYNCLPASPWANKLAWRSLAQPAEWAGRKLEFVSFFKARPHLPELDPRLQTFSTCFISSTPLLRARYHRFIQPKSHIHLPMAAAILRRSLRTIRNIAPPSLSSCATLAPVNSTICPLSRSFHTSIINMSVCEIQNYH